MSLTPRLPRFLHGGDYNPDQWLDRPDILQKDIELMHKAHVNCVSIGIFSWALLEPGAWGAQVDNVLYLGLPLVEELVFTGRWKAIKKRKQ